ncbi:elongator complex protein 6-like [Dorcoceras hygrometricum]|uniref:Elongator complex protein 6-like n=1 Tax=Dorcoceras hygrometricum TaxID=472368 RepID=A0A2Z7BCS9_9LAMI|nr:elongator complex protein 6-like [Dorcoceras hygrometricum]
MTNLSSNLLEEALGFPYDSKGGAVVSGGGGNRFIVVEDCVDTSGAFVLHHLLKRSLAPQSSDVVIFLSFSQPFSHYDRILRKMGCNLVAQREKKRLLFFDVQHLDRDDGKSSENLLLQLYGKVHKAVEVCSASEGLQNLTIMIDDVSLMEIDADGSSDLVLKFLHYCYSLTTQFGCSLVTLNHEDVYSEVNRPTLVLQLEHLADVLIKAEPLATGLASDVHGQLTVLEKGVGDFSGKSRNNKLYIFQFRIKESGVEYFYPGSCT